MNEINMLQEPCTAIGIYPNLTAAYIGDIITFCDSRTIDTESVTKIRNALDILTEIRDIRTNKLVKKIEDESKKYYNEVEIK